MSFAIELTDILFNIIGSEKEISITIVEYSYMKTILDNKSQNICLQLSADEISYLKNDRNGPFMWLDNNHFHTMLHYNTYNIYKIKNNNINLLFSFQKTNICNNLVDHMIKKMILMHAINTTIIFWFKSEFNNYIVRYDYKIENIHYKLKIENVVDIATNKDELIVSTIDCIYKYDYSGKMVNKINANSAHYIRDTLFCAITNPIDSIGISLVNINNMKTYARIIDRDARGICYDYNNEKVIVKSLFERTTFDINDTDGKTKNCVYNYTRRRYGTRGSSVYMIEGNMLAHDIMKKSQYIYVYDIYTNNLKKRINIVSNILSDGQLYLSPSGQYIIYCTDNNKVYLSC